MLERQDPKSGQSNRMREKTKTGTNMGYCFLLYIDPTCAPRAFIAALSVFHQTHGRSDNESYDVCVLNVESVFTEINKKKHEGNREKKEKNMEK